MQTFPTGVYKYIIIKGVIILTNEEITLTTKQKPFSKITVSELINECNVNRKTFYYHFQDIFELLKWTFEQEAFSIVKQ